MTKCPHCRGADTGEIRFTDLAEGAHFHYCRNCEHRWWTAKKETIDLESIFAEVRSLPRVS